MPTRTSISPIVSRGDEEALFRAHHAKLVHTVRRAAGVSDQAAEDACSFAWMQLLRYQPDRPTVFAWLVTVAVRNAWRTGRSTRGVDSLDAIGDWEQLLGEDVAAAALDARAALRDLAALPDRQRRYLTMHIAGYSYTEIAHRHDATFTNVAKNLHRARRNMRKLRPSAT